MESAKTKIDACVSEYINIFPAEYKQFGDWSEQVRKDKKDKYAKMGTGEGLIERKLGEIPEQLYIAIIKILDPEEKDWFLAQGKFLKDFKGPYWFYKKYPVFAITVV